MQWIFIFILKLTALQYTKAIYLVLPPKGTPKLLELYSGNSSLFQNDKIATAFLLHDHVNINNWQEKNEIAAENRNANENNQNNNKRATGRPTSVNNNKRKVVQKRKIQADRLREIDYLDNAIKANNNEQQQGNENKHENKHKNKTRKNTNNNRNNTESNTIKQINTFSDKQETSLMMTKKHAGHDYGIVGTVLPMRVENVAQNAEEFNEVLEKRTENTEKQKAAMKINKQQNAAAMIEDEDAAGGVNTPSDKVAKTAAEQTSTKHYKRLNNFSNPFGQLASAFFGNDQLNFQDYGFFFNAERHTVFQLHTNSYNNEYGNNNNNNFNPASQHVNSNALPVTLASESGRIWSAVFGVNSSGGQALTANPMTAATTTTMNIHPTAYNNNNLSPTAVVKVEEVQLYNGTSLRQSRFNPFNPTRILIHGWLGGSSAGVYQTLVPAYLRRGNGNYNVFTVDWGRGAIADYLTASYRVKPVGKVLAKFIDFLQREAGMRFEDLHVIGFSMGAHIAGIAGKHIQSGRLPVIYALDPALPFFRYDKYVDRITITDADYVEVVHTSVGSYGYDRPLGHVDFYVNFGNAQPGCFFNECSHMRAYQIFGESLQEDGQPFRGQGCDVKLWAEMVKQRRCPMGTGREMVLGGDPLNVTALRGRGGVFYLATNAAPPYAIGERRRRK